MDLTKRLHQDPAPRAISAATDSEHAPRSAAADQAADAATRMLLGPDPVQVANQFYAAFATKNSATMAALYAPNVHFHDPLFGNLHGSEVMRMWNTIQPAANPFQISPGPASAPTRRADGASEVRVHWDAHYGIGKASIINHSDTTLVIKDGRIIEHRDVWNLDAWTAQALPAHLGGHVVTDVLAHAAAHAYIVVLDEIRRLHG